MIGGSDGCDANTIGAAMRLQAQGERRTAKPRLGAAKVRTLAAFLVLGRGKKPNLRHVVTLVGASPNLPRLVTLVGATAKQRHGNTVKP